MSAPFPIRSLYDVSVAPDDVRQEAMAFFRANPEVLEALEREWDTGWSRPEQREPPGEWLIWAYIAGRGAGKTRTGAEWVRKRAKSKWRRLAILAPTASDIEKTIINGESGILATADPANRPKWIHSQNKLKWPSGAIGYCFSAEEPERLRGPQFHDAWCDELAAWRYMDAAWDMLMFGLRLPKRDGGQPQVMVTTTPKPYPLVRKIMRKQLPGVVLSLGTTYDNRANLASGFYRQVITRYEGTRLGRQELQGDLLDDVPGALWTRGMLDDARHDAHGRVFVDRRKTMDEAVSETLARHPDLQRVVVSVDPSGGGGNTDPSETKANSIGIVIAGKGVDGLAYVLGDYTCDLSPAGWGRRAVEAYKEFNADRIVAERNFGGAMVEFVIRTVDQSVPYREVTASRGKVARAEPVAALYEQNRVKHVGSFPDLEDQMCQMTGDGFLGEGSPDRVDALVWAITELMLGHNMDVNIGSPIQVAAGEHINAEVRIG